MNSVELIRKEPIVKYLRELERSEERLADSLADERRKAGVLLTFCILSFLLNIALLAILFA